MIKIRCIICDDEIKKPRIDQLCCTKESCRDEFNANQIDLWKISNPDKVKEMNKRSYKQRKDIQPKTV